MAITQREEKRLLTGDEFDTVARTHYPEICDLDRKQLSDAQKRLRELRDKARGTSRQQRREMRGKSAPKGAKPAADNTGTTRKEQAFASALKRVNREISRFEKADKGSESQRDIMLRALEQKRAARRQTHPSAGRTAHGHMSATPDPDKHPKVDPSPPGG